MKREFNVTGLCVPNMHYMVYSQNKINEIIKLIEKGKYFTINRPRQFGKTTTISLLSKNLTVNGYLVIRLSFEGIGDDIFMSEKDFIHSFIRQIKRSIELQKKEKFLEYFSKDCVNNFEELSNLLTNLTKNIKRKVILIIDEVDKSSNNQLFLSFLGMLRNKYLLRNEGLDFTFHSVILAGVYDVKTLKLKLRPDEERKYNSPWNIATDFKVDMTFNPKEISTMLIDYAETENVKMDIMQIAERIYYFTSGHPFLVSKICKVIDEELLINVNKWEISDVDKAVKKIVDGRYSNTNFDSLIKNIENNPELYDLIFNILVLNKKKTFDITNPIINLGVIYGIFSLKEEIIKIQNRIYEQRIYNYMVSKTETSDIENYNFQDNFIIHNNKLDFEKVLLKFQEFMKKEYSEKDKKFLERNGRLIFLAFLKPIINGKGWDFKEVQISQEKRLDVVVTFMEQKYIVELKKWYGENYHKKGIEQLSDYLERQNQKKGYLIIFDIDTKEKKWKQDRITINNKDIFAVWV